MFVVPVALDPSSGGLIQYCTFNLAPTIDGGSKTVFSHNSFDANGVIASGSANQTINLANNWWGTTNATAIAGLITDHNDNANLPTVTFQPVLTVDPTLPDLTPTAVAVSTGTWSAGQTINVGFSLKNIAGAASAPASTVSFALQSVSTGATYSLGLVDVSAIAAGASASGSATLTLPAANSPFFAANGLPGNYRIVETVDATNVIIEQFEVNNSRTSGTVAITAPGSIAGTLFNDANINGVKDANEAGLAYWVVFIDTNHNGVLDAGEAVAVTSSTGQYSFAGLVPGTYRVTEILQQGYRSTTGPIFSDVAVTAGAAAAAPAFGDTNLAEVTGSVFGDANGDGIRQASETGLAGYRVFADVNGTGVYAANDPSVLTDAMGNFSLILPGAGTYKIEVVTGTHHTTTPVGGSFTLTLGNGGVASGKVFGVK